MAESFQEISRLIGSLYEAAADPAQFQGFVEDIVRRTGSSKGYFLFVDSEHQYNLFLSTGFSDDMRGLYTRDFLQRDLVLDAYIAAQKRTGGDWIGDRQSVLKDREFFRSDVFNGFLRRGGDLYICAAALGAMPNGMQGGFALQRSASSSAYETDTIDLLTILTPHMKQALILHRELAHLRDRSAMLSHSAEAFDLPVISLGKNGAVISMSPAASAILNRQDGLVIQGGLVTSESVKEAAELHRLIQHAARVTDDDPATMIAQSNRHAPQASSAGRWTPGYGGAMQISRSSGRPPYRVAVYPFKTSHLLVDDRPCVLLFIHDTSRRPPSRGVLLAGLHGLTPVEARLVDLLVAGDRIATIAGKLRMTQVNARYHLGQIFHKTGTRSQVDLVRLALTLPGFPE